MAQIFTQTRRKLSVGSCEFNRTNAIQIKIELKATFAPDEKWLWVKKGGRQL
jgi:hypothetical protein